MALAWICISVFALLGTVSQGVRGACVYQVMLASRHNSAPFAEAGLASINNSGVHYRGTTSEGCGLIKYQSA
ncbi:hypothetical protein AOLI_G00278220 [Acnodon oligacanthus]